MGGGGKGGGSVNVPEPKEPVVYAPAAQKEVDKKGASTVATDAAEEREAAKKRRSVFFSENPLGGIADTTGNAGGTAAQVTAATRLLGG